MYTSRTSRNHPPIHSKPILTADLTAGLTAEASKYGSGKLENRPYKENHIAMECERCYYNKKYYVNRMEAEGRRADDKAGSFNGICTGMPENFAGGPVQTDCLWLLCQRRLTEISGRTVDI